MKPLVSWGAEVPVDVDSRWDRLMDLRGPDVLALVAHRVTRTPALRRLSGDLIEVVAALLEAARDRFFDEGRTKAADYRLFLECLDKVVSEVEAGDRALRSSGERFEPSVGRSVARSRYTSRRLTQVASPVVDEMDALVFGDQTTLRLCTPSILLGQPQLADPLGSDVSVSYTGELGSPLEFVGKSGRFADTAALVTRCYRGEPGKDQAFLLTNGSTGANWTVALYLQRTLEPGERVLVSRGAHISLPQALTDLRVLWDYLPAHTREGLDGVPVTTAAEVVAALAGRDDVRALCLNGPTYEGLFLDVAGIRSALDADGHEKVLLIVDEAWGAHLPFSPRLADRAAFAQGADIVNASVHKQGGALQGSAVLVARGFGHDGERRVDVAALQGAFSSVASTSPPYQLLASMDAAFRTLEADGGRMIEDCIELAAELARRLHRRGGLALFGRDASGAWDESGDPLKVTVVLPDDVIGFGLQRALEDAHIVVEKATFETLTLLVPFQLLTWQLEGDALGRVESAVAVLMTDDANPLPRGRPALGDPLSAGRTKRWMEAHVAAALRSTAIPVDYGKAVGAIAAERVAAYPPGVPIVAEGYEIGQAEADYLAAVHRAGGHLVSNGGSKDGQVLVVPPDRDPRAPGREPAPGPTSGPAVP